MGLGGLGDCLRGGDGWLLDAADASGLRRGAGPGAGVEGVSRGAECDLLATGPLAVFLGGVRGHWLLGFGLLLNSAIHNDRLERYQMN